MATFKHNLLVEDTTGSIKKRKQEIVDLNNQIDSLKRNANAASSSTKAAAASYRGENTAYGQARGTTGATGAGARDFANEAQGLGGLVRLYATYAANVFAVSAAFSALSNAMDTTMMIKGLDQLGAASGVALGGLAKQFAAASDGAISMREAMEATAKATGAGLSKKQFMELGQVAKSTSQILGVNMSDAVSRLTRGITKLEPELLDELGLFTKVGKASEDYAKKVGKTVEQLTDFEKRQAFANAVLKEGRDKFGEIAAEANPYDRLLAGLKNVAQDILEVVNKTIAPIANLLANNTALIGLAIAAAALKITRQALPALSQWRSGLKDAAQDAVKRAEEINTKFGEAFVERAQQRAKIPQLETELAAMKQSYGERAKLFLSEENQLKKNSAISKALAEGEVLTKRQIGAIQAEITKKQGDTTEAAKKHVAGLQQIVSIQSQMVSKQNDLVKANQVVEDQAGKRSRFMSAEWQREQIVINARAKAANLSLLSTVGEKVESKGFIGGLGSFYSDVAASKDLNKFEKLKTGAIGTFTGIATAVGILGSALSRVMMVIEIAVVIFTALDAIFSTNDKASRALSTAIDDMAESTKTATKVMEKYKDTISFESINASANAFTNLSDSIASAGKNFEKFNKDSSGWNNFIEGVKSLANADMRTKVSKGIANSIVEGIKLTPEGEQRQALEANLRKTLNTQELTFDSIAKAMEAYSEAGVVTKAGDIVVQLEKAGLIVKNSQALTQQIKESGEAAKNAFLTFQNSVFASSPLQTFLLTTYNNTLALEKGFKDSATAAAAFTEIAAGNLKLDFLPSQVAQQIQKMADGFKSAMPSVQKLLSEEAAKVIGSALTASVDNIFKEFQLKLKQTQIQGQKAAMALLPIKTTESIEKMYQLEVAAIKIDADLRKNQQSLIISIDRNTAQLEANRAALELQALVQTPIPYAEADQAKRNTDIFAAGQAAIRANKINQAIQTGKVNELTAEEKRDPAIIRMQTRGQATRLIDQETQQKLTGVAQTKDKELLDLRFQDRKKILDAELKAINDKFELDKLTAADDAERAKLSLERLQKVLPKELELAQMPISQQLGMVGIAGKYGVSQDILKSQAGQLGLDLSRVTAGTTGTQATTTAAAERETLLAETKKASESRVRDLEKETVLAQEKLAQDKDSLAVQTLLLEQQKSRGVLTQEQYIQQKIGLDLQDAALERDSKISEGFRTQQKEIESWGIKYAEANYNFTEALNQELQGINLRATVTETAAQREYTARKRVADQDLQNAQRLTFYGDSFKQIFDGMADVLINFVKTGKIEFESLINSMLEGLLRYEIQLQTTAMYAAMRPGLMSFLGSLLPGVGTSMSMGTPMIDSTATMAAVTATAAKGRAYDYGVEAFAKGGTFTNSIVNSPTLFKFAKGTGLMGEAGPEAIMPLSRDSSGNLGVRNPNNNNGKIDVIVNNYGNQQVETKESVDSRGTRRIELTIGDLNAGEISRTGSSSQRAMSGSFGLQPLLIRR